MVLFDMKNKDILKAIQSIYNRKDKYLMAVVNGKAYHDDLTLDISKQLKLRNWGDGWYWIEICKGNIEISEAPPLDVRLTYQNRAFTGYGFHNEFVPYSFNLLKVKWGIRDHSAQPIHLLPRDLDWWSYAVIPIETHGNVIFFFGWEHPSSPLLMKLSQKFTMKEHLDIDKPIIDIKGLTPELRYLYFLYLLEYKTQQELLKAKKEEEFKRTLVGRVKSALEEVGAHLIELKQRGNNLEVVWSIQGEKFNSLINPENFQVKEAGFCVEGMDNILSLKSMVLTAQDFIEKDLIYKTRF